MSIHSNIFQQLGTQHLLGRVPPRMVFIGGTLPDARAHHSYCSSNPMQRACQPAYSTISDGPAERT